LDGNPTPAHHRIPFEKTNVNRRFTQAHIKNILEGWPQAISTDESDLRVLHDRANAGAQMWGESLSWPDFLWLGLERPAPPPAAAAVERIGIRVLAPNGLGPDADLGILTTRTVHFVGTGRHPLASRIDCILELKAITIDHVPKLSAFTPKTLHWPQYLDKKLRDVFWGRLEEGDKQIRDFRRILGFPTARGVTILVNEGSPSLNPVMVGTFLKNIMKQGFQHTDAVVYLSDRPDRPHMSVMPKRSDDDVVLRFSEELFMMLGCVDWSTGVPRIRGGPYPRLGIRIEMDDRSYQMYRNWCTGWRHADDPAPIPTPNPRLQFVPLSAYKSGLPPR